jgi:hypothetical protein
MIGKHLARSLEIFSFVVWPHMPFLHFTQALSSNTLTNDHDAQADVNGERQWMDA